MENKAADLSKIKIPIFVGLGCWGGFVYALTVDGHLYVIGENKKTEKWMNIKVAKALGLWLASNMLFCACTDGIVWIFDCETLQHI